MNSETINQEFISYSLARLDAKLNEMLLRVKQDDQDAKTAAPTEVDRMIQLTKEPPFFRRGASLLLPDETINTLTACQREIDDRLKTLWTDDSSCLRRAADCFALSQTELEILIVCLAPCLDKKYQRLFSFLDNGKKSGFPSADLILRLTVPDGMDRLRALGFLYPGRPLMDAGLIRMTTTVGAGSALDACFCAAAGMDAWLLGEWRADFYDGKARLTPWNPNAEAVHSSEPSALSKTAQLYSYIGPDLLKQERTAASAAMTGGLGFLRLDLNRVDSTEIPLYLRFAARDAALQGAALIVNGLDSVIQTGGIFPAGIADCIAKAVCPVVLNTLKPFVFAEGCELRDRSMIRVYFEKISYSERIACWQNQLLNEMDNPGTGLDERSIRRLAGQFTLSTAQIEAAVPAARSFSLAENRPLSLDDLYHGARICSLHHLDDLAKKMPARYRRCDLILPEAPAKMLDELIAMAKNRAFVLEEWDAGKKLTAGTGISALFTGPPGTGKTLSAQIVAGELGLDLYRVDLSTVVSKYIGDTEKNLEKIFTEAQDSNVILFFDEADALFGKRSDVGDSHDRYANIEVGYLLQRIETYDGLVLMATNLGANLDEAFTRRVSFIIDFPFPESDARLRLWETLIPEAVPRADDLDLMELAERYKVAGGGIRNAIVCAIYNAAEAQRPLCQADLLHGIHREMQKMGKVYKV